MKYGETVNFGLDKQIERLVEVLAASALLQANSRDMESLQKLRNHAFPDKVAKRLTDPVIEKWLDK